jgi:hypothetical protein
MRRYMLLVSAVALMNLLEANAQDDQIRHEQALAAIRDLGGEIIVGSKKTDARVTVVLTGSDSPVDCLPFLNDVSNLHTCDL